MVRRGEITNQAWEQIQPLLPTNDGESTPDRLMEVYRGFLARLAGSLWITENLDLGSFVETCPNQVGCCF